MNIKKGILTVLFAGQDKSFFENHKEEIHLRNSRMVGVLSLVITIVLFVFFVLSKIIEVSFGSPVVFLSCSIYFFVLHCIYEFFIRKHIMATNLYLNVLLWSLYFSLMALNLNNNSTSVYIPVFFVLLFTLTISAPIYTFASATLAFFIYLVFVLYTKEYKLALEDILNMVISFCIGVSIGWVVLVERIYAIKSKTEQKLLAQQAEAANNAKSQFLSRMTHDIRTPINGVMGMTEIAKRNLDDKNKLTDCLDKITIASEHLLSLVNDILDINKIENGNVQLTKDPVKINELVENCCVIVEGQFNEKKIEFEKDFIYGDHITVLCDELHLRQVFINILGNSLKYTPTGGKISFKVRELSFDDEKVTYNFEIADTGIGMPEEFLPHIWDSFSQVNINTGDSTGSGLGMAIAKSLVDTMGGNISVESKLGEGSLFKVQITFTIGTEEIEEVIAQKEMNLNGIKLLVVEDNQLNTEIVQVLLEDEGSQVICAKNGEEAVKIFSNSEIGEFDGILMDIIMPVMDGIEATKQIRALDRADSKLIPIVAMTANAFESDEQKSKEAGMNAHLTKPLRIKEIKSTLYTLINKSE